MVYLVLVGAQQKYTPLPPDQMGPFIKWFVDVT